MSAQTAIEFVKREIEDEWGRLVREFSQFSSEEFTWQPDAHFHSIGWHVRHVIEWRYALIHIWICRKRADEAMYCLGWENEPIVQAISRNRGWCEPSFSVWEDLRLLDRVRAVTRQELDVIDPRQYGEPIAFPWRSNSVLAEISQDLRHSALHRGQIRQMRMMYAKRDDLTAASLTKTLPSIEYPGQPARAYQNQSCPFQSEAIETQ